MVSGSSKGQQVPKGRRDMGIPEGPAGQGLPHPGSIPLPPVRQLGRLGAAGNSPLPWALGSSMGMGMGMSWGQAGMSAYKWGSGSGPVRELGSNTAPWSPGPQAGAGGWPRWGCSVPLRLIQVPRALKYDVVCRFTSSGSVSVGCMLPLQ